MLSLNELRWRLAEEEPMNELSRRSMLGELSGLARVGATLLLPANSRVEEKRREPDRKLRVVAIGGHFDDPQTCVGGTLTLFADQGHDVVALSLTGGPPPAPGANAEERSVKNRLKSSQKSCWTSISPTSSSPTGRLISIWITGPHRCSLTVPG